jgi:hypothetical protein
MNKWTRRLQLLSLLSIFFIYKTFESMFDGNTAETSFWGISTILYLILMIVALFVNRKSQKQYKIQ